MRQLSKLALYGPATWRSSSTLPTNVCIFCLQHSRLPFSTTAPRAIDMKRKLRREQTERQTRYMEKNKPLLTQHQLLPRARNEELVEFQKAKKEARRNGLPPPQFGVFKDARSRRLRVKKKVAPEGAQQEVDEALDKIIQPRATTWDGMEMVGGETEWDTGARFEGYLPKAKLSKNVDITAAMYQAVVEVFTAMAHGENLTGIQKPTNPRLAIWNVDVSDVRVRVAKGEDTESGQVEIKLEYPSEEAEDRIHRAIIASADGDGENRFNPSRNRSAPGRILPEEQVKTWGSEWLDISLADPKIKLAMIRRLTALVGPIPDFVIHSHHTVGSLLSKLVQPPPAEKLHHALIADEAFVSLPNLSLLPKRDGPVDKETRIGRWKLIRKALREKGLPVLKGVDGWEHEPRQLQQGQTPSEDSLEEPEEAIQPATQSDSRKASAKISEEPSHTPPREQKSPIVMTPPRNKWLEWLGL